MSQTFLPSVILIMVAGISFFVPSDQVQVNELLFDRPPSDSRPPGSLHNNPAHLHFNVQLCSKPHPAGRSILFHFSFLKVSYMKAVDTWVLACLLFVFFCLAEYGIVLHLTSRCSRRKRFHNIESACPESLE